MLFTRANPGHDADRISLYTSLAAARRGQGDGRPIYRISARFEAASRRLIPLWADPHDFDPTWTTPAYDHGDGSIIAKGPIPPPLFVAAPSAAGGDPVAAGPDRAQMGSPEDHGPGPRRDG